ncbi:MAG: SMP-30/gluconolactonase/LRE family protein, partial [Pseudomonadota bacterium]|nr:SMP-30/gluconolactonase/LRE family protein [Pseudomonadota bacterium]
MYLTCRSMLAPLALALLLLLLLGWFPLSGQAEPLPGTPLLRRYLPQDYDAPPQHWAIATGRDGRLFVGNSAGVLRYDGEQWDLIALPGPDPARKVVTGHDGRLYVGSHDTFGWLQPGADGGMVYRELLTAAGLTGSARRIGTVWQVIATADGVYFRSERSLHLLGYDHARVSHWPMAENQRVIYPDGDQLFARIDGVGFTRFVDGRFEPEPGAAVFAQRRLLGVIAQSGWRLLIGDEGFYRADANGIARMPDDAGKQLRGSLPYAAMALGDGSFVVSTLTGELLRFGPDGRLRERIRLGNFGIVALGRDRENGLWAATEGDLVRMSTPSPWSAIGVQQGLDGSVADFEWHDGALWLATSRGVARMQAGVNEAGSNGRIEVTALPWVDLEGFALAGTDSGLLIAHQQGLLVLDPDAQQPRVLMHTDAESVLELLRSRFDRDRVYALGDQRLFVLRRVQGRWQLDAALPLDGARASGLLETGPGELWFGDSRGGPQRWHLDAARRTVTRADVFGQTHGLSPDPGAGSRVLLLDGQVHVV